jgi:glutaredoxin 3
MEEQKQQPKIRVFSTPTCPYCHTLKAFLDEKGFKFEDIDVSADEKARDEMVDKTGQMGVPVVEIGGEIIIGFDREKIIKKLGIKE